jgi:hypothetical protein
MAHTQRARACVIGPEGTTRRWRQKERKASEETARLCEWGVLIIVCIITKNKNKK